jgi:hypothetical protein
LGEAAAAKYDLGQDGVFFVSFGPEKNDIN